MINNYSFSQLKRLTAVVGHFGSGKTNVSVNLALALRKAGKSVSLVDLDIVNPYFRAADSRAELEYAGVSCVIPEYANTNVDIPALPAAVYSVFDGALSGGSAIFDVGGDDLGAAALGGYRHLFEKQGYDMLFVCNMFRPLTSTPEDTVTVLREIEERCGMRCTGLVNNSNLGAETERGTLRSSAEYFARTAELSGVPALFSSSVPRGIDPPGGYVFFMDNVTKNLYGG